MIDLSLAAVGYLVSPDGRYLRHVRGLDVIASDTHAAAVRVSWGIPPDDAPACAYLTARLIVLAPCLWQQWPSVFRRCWLHELAHIITGRRSEASARVWVQRYGDLLVPVFA